MQPHEFNKARRELRLSARQLSDILNVHTRTIRKWESDVDSRPVNPIAARVMRWMLDGYRPPEWPDKPSGNT